MCTSHLVVESLYIPECWPPSPFLSDFTLSILAPTGWRFHRTHCSAPKMLLQVLLALAPPAHLPGLCSHSSLYLVACPSLPESNCLSSTLETQLCFVIPGFLINGWSPACSIVKLSLFHWLLCNSEQPSALWYLISACILLPSGLRSSEAICLLWVMFLHSACAYWAFTLCQTLI